MDSTQPSALSKTARDNTSRMDAGVERRIAAIMAADVVGYSRLMEQDEAGTLVRLKSLHNTIVQPIISKHSGRLFKRMGDGIWTVMTGFSVDLLEQPLIAQATFASQLPESQPQRSF